jgi:ferredoxin
MKVKIDREECISCATCWIDCPDFFEEGEDGTSQVVEPYRVGGEISVGEVPADLQVCVREAAEDCPVEAIQVEE